MKLGRWCLEEVLLGALALLGAWDALMLLGALGGLTDFSCFGGIDSSLKVLLGPWYFEVLWGGPWCIYVFPIDIKSQSHLMAVW